MQLIWRVPRVEYWGVLETGMLRECFSPETRWGLGAPFLYGAKGGISELFLFSAVLALKQKRAHPLREGSNTYEPVTGRIVPRTL